MLIVAPVCLITRKTVFPPMPFLVFGSTQSDFSSACHVPRTLRGTLGSRWNIESLQSHFSHTPTQTEATKTAVLRYLRRAVSGLPVVIHVATKKTKVTM